MWTPHVGHHSALRFTFTFAGVFMVLHFRWWTLALALAFAPACDTSDTDDDSSSGQDELPPGDGNTPPGGDDDEDELPEEGSLALGELCDTDDSCSSGFCVTIGSGKNEGLCSQRCEESLDCGDEDWVCRDIRTGSGNEIRGCTLRTLCIDNDGDGYGIGPECKGSDCDDEDPTVYEGAPEICDGKDNSCDGRIDNSPIDIGRPCNTGLEGVCADGVSECNKGVLDCIQLTQPGPEICDGLDNDCDGLIDEGVEEDENDNFVAEIGRACSPDGSTCQNGVYVCDPTNAGGLFCDGLGDNAEEICDGIDNNCNGEIDEGIDGLGEICEVGKGLCVRTSARVCDPTNPHAPPICDVEPNWDNKRDEVCDYIDNNCDGEIDEPFKNESDVYHTLEHCGGCNVDCNVQWGSEVDPASVHAQPTCKVSGNSASCAFTCTDGYVDMDGVVSNGCELLPDDDAIYVATRAKGGADSNRCGTYDAPCETIGRGIERADSAKRSKVRVSDGVFREGITLIDGISVLGGHSSINWLRDTTVNSTVIYGASKEFTEDSVAVVAKNITTTTELSGLTITSPDADASGNSIALYIENASNKLKVIGNTLQAGFGGTGSTGASGNDGNDGASGAAGSKGSNTTSCTSANWIQGGGGGSGTCGGTITSGGKGGGSSCPTQSEDYDPSLTAKKGSNNSGSTGTGGKSAQAALYRDTTCYIASGGAENNNGTDGSAGRDGSDGGAGAGALKTQGTIASNNMWRGASGAAGKPGMPGGGGGGGGASRGLEYYESSLVGIAPSGGGGGAGGCGGASAQGGSAGGGSFALYLIHTSGNAPSIVDNTLVRGVGGTGGAGGLGGSGGNGGAGGHGGDATYGGSSGNGCAKTGRRGGDGGRGGQGGGGGGGAGGDSFDIATRGIASSAIHTILNGNDFMIDDNEDTAGQGGDGGPSIGNDGEAGESARSGRNVELP